MCIFNGGTMQLKEIDDITEFLYYLNQKNDSMDPPMWKKEDITKEHFQEIYDEYQIFLAVEDEIVIGGLLLLQHDYNYWNEQENKDNCFYIHKLFILPAYNGKGYSKRIVDEVEKIARKHGKMAIRLDSRVYLTSLNALYDRLGFTIQRVMESSLSGTMNLRQRNIK